jgi:hypothetical protein
MAQCAPMAKKKAKETEKSMTSASLPAAPADRHGTRHQMNIPDPYYTLLQALAKRYGRPMSWQLRMILQEALRAEGLWPPPDAARE